MWSSSTKLGGMRTIHFEVKGELPPKKRTKSMWGNPMQARRLIALRKKALEAFGSRKPLTKNIRLSLLVCIGPWKGAAKGVKPGDLDNFIAGVCDGLMRADPRASWDPLFRCHENAAVAPCIAIAFEDDSHVTEICAKTVVHDGDDGYRIELWGE